MILLLTTWLQERFSSGAFSSDAFSSDALSFNINFFALWLVQPEPLWIRLWLWSCTLEQMFSISNWKFLISCYHQNIEGDFAKQPLFQQTLVVKMKFWPICLQVWEIKRLDLSLDLKHDMWYYFVLYLVKWKYRNDPCRENVILAYMATKFDEWECWTCPLI